MVIYGARIDWDAPALTTFAPINEDHAVTWVKFGLQVDEAIDLATLEMAKSRGEWLKELPAVTNLPPVRVSTGMGTLEVPAIQFAIVQPDGSPLWALKISGQIIEVECRAYTRWDPTWKKAEKYLNDVWSIVRSEQEEARIIDFNLEVEDRFTSTHNKYDISDLFRPSDYFNPSSIFSSGVWHSKAGWFEQDPDANIINTLTLQSNGEYDGSKFNAPYAVVARHLINFVSRDSTLSPGSSIDLLDHAVNVMHERNKSTLLAILSEDMAGRIGLKQTC